MLMTLKLFFFFTNVIINLFFFAVRSVLINPLKEPSSVTHFTLKLLITSFLWCSHHHWTNWSTAFPKTTLVSFFLTEKNILEDLSMNVFANNSIAKCAFLFTCLEPSEWVIYAETWLCFFSAPLLGSIYDWKLLITFWMAGTGISRASVVVVKPLERYVFCLWQLSLSLIWR